jgi:hypothetical protein
MDGMCTGSMHQGSGLPIYKKATADAETRCCIGGNLHSCPLASGDWMLVQDSVATDVVKLNA